MPFLSILSYSSFAENCYTTANYTWSCGTPTSSDSLIISHPVVISDDFRSTAVIIIENNGSLEIDGNFYGTNCNVIVKNEGSFKVNGEAKLEGQCTVNVEGELKVQNSLKVESGTSIYIWGSVEVNGSVLLKANSIFNLKKNSTFLVSNSFNNFSDATEIDGDMTIMLGLLNANLITGIGAMSFNYCTSTGLINDLTPGEYCSSSPLNLLESHCSSTDNEAPQFISYPNDIISYASAETCEVKIEWESPEVTDNCSIEEIVGSHDSGHLFQVDTTTVTYNATDKAGNEATIRFNVIVKDTISPIINDLINFISADAELSTCGALVSWNPPTAEDNCSVVMTFDYNPGDFFPIGTTTVTYVAVDPSGNETREELQIKVKNPHAPVFTTCPIDTIVYTDKTNCEMEIVWKEPEATGCDLEITQTHFPGDLFSPGIHFVKYNATDISGNVSICEFVIQVLDTIAPEFISCPTEYLIESTDTLAEKSIIAWDAPEVVDNCTTVTLQSNHQSGDKFDLGITEVIYIALDESGNESICRFEVEAFINNPPVLESQVLFADAGEAIYICLTAEDPDDDHLFLDSIAYGANNSIISDVDTFNLCFNYVSSLDFDGVDSITVYVVDNGILPLRSHTNVYINVKGDRTIKVASAITVNEDGINDKWIISNIKYYPTNSVHVFDPYGGLIFQTTGYNNNEVVWEGKNADGEYVPEGTYFFAIIPGSNQEKITGAIEVIR